MSKTELPKLIEMDWSKPYSNLTQENYLSEANKPYDLIREALETIDGLALETPYENLDNLFFMQPFSTWSEEEREDAFNAIMDLRDTAAELHEHIFFGGVEEANGLFDALECDYEANNFLGASGYIEDVAKYFDDIFEIYKENVPDVDFGLPSHKDSQISTSAQAFSPMYGFAYPLDECPDADYMNDILMNAMDTSIIEMSGRYFIASNSSEMNRKAALTIVRNEDFNQGAVSQPKQSVAEGLHQLLSPGE